MEIFSLIAKVITAPLIGLLALAGLHVPQTSDYTTLIQNVSEVQELQVAEDQLGATVANTVAGFETSLASSISSSDTTMTLVSFTTDDGTDLVAGKTYGFTIDEGSANREFVIGTATSSNQIINLTRGISVVDGVTEVSANKKAHRRGASVKITNFQFVTLTQILNGDATIPAPLQYATEVATSSLSNDQHLASKAYVDYVAFNGAGVIDATETARGVIELATQLEMASSTESGSSGTLVLQSKYATSSAPSSGHYVVVTQSDGDIDDNLISDSLKTELRTSYNKASAIFGDGSDGDVTVATSSTVELTRDMYYENLTVNGTLVTNGYRVFVSDTIDGTGTVKVPDGNDGGDGGDSDGSSAGSSGAGATSTPSGIFYNRAGTDGGTSPVADVGGLGNPGGASATAGSVSGVDDPTNSVGIPFESGFNYGLTASPVWGLDMTSSTTIRAYHAPAGGQGGQRGRFQSQGGGGTTGAPGGPGGGGASGGVVWIIANTWAGTFTIQAIGGDGGDAGVSVDGYYHIGQSTGGAGGAGGVTVFFYLTKTWTGTYDVSGGTAGANSTGGYDYSASGTSEDGPDGVSYEIRLY